MVSVLIIGQLVGIALPTFLGMQERGHIRAAQSDLRNGASAASAVWASTEDFSGQTEDTMEAAEPGLSWVAAGTASASGNSYSISFRVWNSGEVNMARMSESGTCYYIRVIETQGSTASDIPGTYMGAGIGTCTGSAVANLATSAANFPGWT
jgi:Tfp pilus assembly protein PilE